MAEHPGKHLGITAVLSGQEIAAKYRIEAILMRLEPKITESLSVGAKAVDLAEVKGRVAALPTWWMLMVTVLSTWLAGAGIVFTLVKATHP